MRVFWPIAAWFTVSFVVGCIFGRVSSRHWEEDAEAARYLAQKTNVGLTKDTAYSLQCVPWRVVYLPERDTVLALLGADERFNKKGVADGIKDASGAIVGGVTAKALADAKSVGSHLNEWEMIAIGVASLGGGIAGYYLTHEATPRCGDAKVQAAFMKLSNWKVAKQYNSTLPGIPIDRALLRSAPIAH